jgi:hypothetical protein
MVTTSPIPARITKTMKLKSIRILSFSLMTAAAGVVVAEEATPAVARKVMAQYQDAVVWVSAVAKVNVASADGKPLPFRNPDREQKVEAVGTVVATNGLTLIALSSVDAAGAINGREIPTDNGTIKIEASTTIKEARIILADGTEVPADLVMKDSDLDLAFLLPKADSKEFKNATFKPVDLKKSATVEIADEVIGLSRADEVLNRQPSVMCGQIITVTKKPRVFLRSTACSPGCPLFVPDGRLAGIAVNRFLVGKLRDPMTVVLPAADVLEIAEQAMKAKPAPAADKAPASSTPAAPTDGK